MSLKICSYFVIFGNAVIVGPVVECITTYDRYVDILWLTTIKSLSPGYEVVFTTTDDSFDVRLSHLAWHCSTVHVYLATF
jgi:hypothetical protein